MPAIEYFNVEFKYDHFVALPALQQESISDAHSELMVDTIN